MHMLDDILNYTMGGPRTDSKPSHRKTASGKINGKVTRVRTGCLTCRGRRKKCDERKPGCGNCERAGYHCEGYPAKLRWKEGRGIDRVGAGSGSTNSSSSEIMDSPSSSMTSNAVTRTTANDGTAGYKVWSNHNQPQQQHQQTPVAPTYNTTFAEPTTFEDGLEVPYTPLVQSQHSMLSLGSGSAYFPQEFEQLNNMAMVGGPVPILAQNMQALVDRSYLSPISRSLPYPIENIRTGVEKRLFHHFTAIFSHYLTTSNITNEISPFSEVVIPLAIKDRTVMKTILSLSGSHLLKDRSKIPELETERQRLHSSAVEIQNERESNLLKWSKSDPETRYAYSLEEQEILLATSTLLYLYELCEGSSDKSIRKHLDMARSSITLISPNSNDIQPSEAEEKVVTEVQPLLLEFFNYHDSLAAVTIPTLQSRPHYVSRHPAILQNRTSLIVDDLMRFMSRIAPLRMEPSIGIRVSKAGAIHQDLENWKPDASCSNDQKMISQFYKWALAIWLFSIMRPEEKHDHNIQTEVPLVLTRMQDISDNVKACLLFPLFIAGGAAICEEDRETVRGLFRMLMDWSSLGNIAVSLKVVEDMWINHDLGIAKAWDWVDHLQGKELTLLVT